jgi:predicted DNA-binding protein
VNHAKKDRSRVRDERFAFRLPTDTKNKLEDAANKRGLTMSAMARMIIVDYLSERG